ncbi:RIP homotypic interaction motif-containing protein [Nocardia callitridis]|uniref:Uncharacterized protein n=1 Tax=Nocardia callitridis TaxID=648753 RepID=A0ABP9K1X4_9NOCA
MDILTIISTALIAGAAAGGKDAASAAVRDAYGALRDRLGGGNVGEVVEANELAPGGNIGELETTLEQHLRASDTEQLRAAAETLLSRLPSDQVDQARNRVDLSHAKGVQIGNHNTQHNSFG